MSAKHTPKTTKKPARKPVTKSIPDRTIAFTPTPTQPEDLRPHMVSLAEQLRYSPETIENIRKAQVEPGDYRTWISVMADAEGYERDERAKREAAKKDEPPRDFAAELRESEIPRTTTEIETQETHVLRYSAVWGHERETDRSVGDLLSAMFNSGSYDADDLGPGLLSFVGSYLDLLRDSAEFVDGGITDSAMLVYLDKAQSFAENGAELARRFNAAREVQRRPAKGAA